MGEPPLKIEIMTTISGAEFEICYQERKQVEIDGIAVNLISLERLMENKKASGRTKDINDLENLS